MSRISNKITITDYNVFIKNKAQQIDIKEPAFYINKFSFLKQFSDFFPCAIYLLNYQTQEYLFVNESCIKITGYTASEHISMGQIGFLNTCMHPDDARQFKSNVFKKFVNTVHQISGIELKKCRSSMNYRLVRKDRQIVKILQQSVIVETTNDGYPWLTIGVLIDITDHKFDNKMALSVTHYNEKKGFTSFSTNQMVNDSNPFTKKENEIIKHMKFGHTTKVIAQKLFVSPYTINAHKRNIYKKANCKNIAELISFCMDKGL